MAISFGAHCRYSKTETQRRIDFMRMAHPEWFGGVLHLTDALDLGPFGHEIACGFGIDAKSRFGLHVLNHDWLDEVREAVEYVYRVFGTDDLVVTFENDSIRPPLRPYPAMRIA
jgi:hypothetical protein